ncbi:MAG: hypothetical protein N2645_03550 [Clostridia bacterium]|nr:hypothetical protein [Clostridia bacterium]
MACNIPEECKLDLWAKVIIAKNTQTDEPILGSFDEYGEPVPYNLVVTGLDTDEYVECVDDFKIVYGDSTVSESFICTSKVILTITFTGHFWVKTNKGFKTVTQVFTFTKTIPVNEFIKLDGTPLTSCEFKANVDQSKAVVCNYEVAYINVLQKVLPDQQTIQIIITATIIDKLGKYRDVIVYGVIEDLGCKDPCCCP